jgi:uncharacterized membrane protein YesL
VQDTLLRRFLERVADLTIIGLLTLACCLGVVTGLAGLTAATATLAGQYEPGPVSVRFLLAFRQSWRSTIALQLAWLVVLAVGAADLFVAFGWAEGQWYPVGLVAPVLACGILLLAAAAVMPTYLAVAQVTNPGPIRTVVRRAAVMACGMPLTTLTIGGMVLVFTAVGLVLPVLAPLLVGTHVLIALTAIRAATRRVRPSRSRSHPTLSLTAPASPS